MNRRKFIRSAGLTLPIARVIPAGILGVLEHHAKSSPLQVEECVFPEEPADYTIHIGTGLVEVAPQHIISTTTYNGLVPGPLLRFKEGQQTVVDIYNDTDRPEQLHWHGQFVSMDGDGSAEEGTPHIKPHGMPRETFIPKPSGLKFYHTHTVAGSDLSAGQYSGQVGAVYIEPATKREGYDREEFLVLKEFEALYAGRRYAERFSCW